MTEKDFWKWVNKLQVENWPKLLATGAIFTNAPKELEQAKRIYADKADLEESEELPKDKIVDIGKLLFDKNISRRAKEFIIMTLAHESCKEAVSILKQYNKSPDKGVEYFAHFALEECEWNE